MKTTIILLFLILISCKPLHSTINTENEAIKNVIMDYLKYNHKNKLIEIEILKKSKKYYVFTINDDVLFVPLKTDTIGGYTHSFPTNYIKKKDFLFVWNDKEKVLNHNLVNLLRKYNCIDSLHYTNKGEIFINVKRKQYYFVCKNNILKYKKKKAIWIRKENYPNMKCLK